MMMGMMMEGTNEDKENYWCHDIEKEEAVEDNNKDRQRQGILLS